MPGEPGAEELLRVVELTTGPGRGGPASLLVCLGVDLELSSRGSHHGGWLGLPLCGASARNVSGEPPEKPQSGCSRIQITPDILGNPNRCGEIVNARAKRANNTPIHRPGRYCQQTSGGREQIGRQRSAQVIGPRERRSAKRALLIAPNAGQPGGRDGAREHRLVHGADQPRPSRDREQGERMVHLLSQGQQQLAALGAMRLSAAGWPGRRLACLLPGPRVELGQGVVPGLLGVPELLPEHASAIPVPGQQGCAYLPAEVFDPPIQLCRL